MRRGWRAIRQGSTGRPIFRPCRCGTCSTRRSAVTPIIPAWISWAGSGATSRSAAWSIAPRPACRRWASAPAPRSACSCRTTPYFVICFFAVLKAGGTVVSYNPLYAEREIAHQIEDSETDLMVTLDLALLLPKLEPMLARTRLKAIIVGKMADILPFPKKLLFPLVKAREIAKVPGRRPPHLVRRSDRQWRRRIVGRCRIRIAPSRRCSTPAAPPACPKGAALTHRNLQVNALQMVAWHPARRARRRADPGAAAAVSRLRHDLHDELRAVRRRRDHPACPASIWSSC